MKKSNETKIVPSVEYIDQKELLPWHEYMRYGSERFKTAEANNHNIVIFTESREIQKIVLGQNVVLTLPLNPDDFDIYAPYPTHQSSWTPMWFNIIYHSQARNEQEREYHRRILDRVTDKDRLELKKSLAYQALKFFLDYQASKQSQADALKNPKKRFKPFTRILQDILLYIDLPDQVIIDQDEFLRNSPIYELVVLANDLRRGKRLDQAEVFESEVSRLITQLVEDCGGLEECTRAFNELIEKVNAGIPRNVFKEDDLTIESGPLYSHLISPAVVLSEDSHDRKLVSIVPGLKKSKFFQASERFGKGLSEERRVDIIAIPENVRLYDTIEGGKETFQSIGMMILSHTAVTEKGKSIQERLSSEITPRQLAVHYLGASMELLNGYAWGKSYRIRSEQAEITQIDKCMPLHIVGRDLLPKAIHMLQTGSFPSGINNEIIYSSTGLSFIAERINKIFELQNATDEELDSIYSDIMRILEQYFTEDCTSIFHQNLSLMNVNISQMKGEGN